MRRKIPLLIVFIGGIIFFFQYFIPSQFSQDLLYKFLTPWARRIGVFAFIIGTYSLIHLHYNKIKRRTQGWYYSVVTLSGLVFMFLCSVVLFWIFPNSSLYGIEKGSIFNWMFVNVQIPMQATMFSLLAFYISSAAYRSFRARSLEATLLLLTATVVMIGEIPLSETIRTSVADWIDFQTWKQWILDIPNMATKRAITFGVGMGMIATSLKIIFGIERSWLGRD